MLAAAPLAHLYLAYLGRPPDAYASLDQYLSAGIVPPGLFRIFWESPEYRALAATEVPQLIGEVYQRLFNRGPEAAGLAYWQGLVTSGELVPDQLPIAILQGARNQDAQALGNKIAAAEDFVSRVDTAPEQANYSGNDSAAVGRAYLAPVTHDPASLQTARDGADAAVAEAVRVGTPPGTAFHLTDQPDVIGPVVPSTVRNTGFGVSTSGPDSFYGWIGAAADRIDGAGGNDTLWLTMSEGEVGIPASAITNVEVVRAFLPRAGVLDLSGVRDMDALFLDAFALQAAGTTATVRGMATSVAVTATLGGVNNQVVLEYADRALAAQAVALDLGWSNGGNLAIPEIEQLSLLARVIGVDVPPAYLGMVSAPDAGRVSLRTEGALKLANFRLAPGAQLAIDAGGFVDAVAGKLSAGEGGHIVINGSGGFRALLHESVASLVSNAGGDVTVTLDPDADPRRSVSIEANGPGPLSIFGTESRMALTARGGSQHDFVAAPSGAVDPAGTGWIGSVLTGGAGNDEFLFPARGAATAAELIQLADTITDFGQAADRDRIRFPEPMRLTIHEVAAPGVARIGPDGIARFDPADATLAQKLAAVENAMRAGGDLFGYSYALFEHEATTHLYNAAGPAAAASYQGAALVRLAGVPLDGLAVALVDGVLVAV